MWNVSAGKDTGRNDPANFLSAAAAATLVGLGFDDDFAELEETELVVLSLPLVLGVNLRDAADAGEVTAEPTVHVSESSEYARACTPEAGVLQ